MTSSHYDAIVVGGGPAGCATALTLARAGVSVALVESTRYDDERWGESVHPAIKRPLDQLGVWDQFSRTAHLPSLGVESFWGSTEPAYTDFLFHPFGRGWHLNRRCFDAMLADASAAAGATLCHARVLAARQATGCWQVTTTGGRLDARVLINAGGRRASVTMPAFGRRYFHHHTVVVGQIFDTDTAASGWTVIEASADGWAYTAPLPGGRQVVMFFTDPEVLRSTSFPRVLSSLPQMSLRLKHAVPRGRPTVRSACDSCRSSVSGDNWVSVGDAASTVDPLSGQGLHRALTDGIAAGQASLAMLGGDTRAGDEFQLRIHRRFAADTAASRQYYQLEGRWPGAPFWRRRRT